MSAEEAEPTQSGHEEGGTGGPGAPTPLLALEVGIIALSDHRDHRLIEPSRVWLD